MSSDLPMVPPDDRGGQTVGNDDPLLFSTDDKHRPLLPNEMPAPPPYFMSSVEDVPGSDKRFRLLDRDTGHFNIKRRGYSRRIYLYDFFYTLVGIRWSKVLPLIMLFEFFVYFIFGIIYFLMTSLVSDECISNTNRDNFLDHFFFSVQTQTTIGYGHMSPVCDAVNVVVTIQSLLGTVVDSLILGVLFAKFSSPMKRVGTIMFSHDACMTPINGHMCFMFRMANVRRSQISQARLRLMLARNELNAFGEIQLRVYELRLSETHKSPFLALPCMIVHRIDESSPLFGMNAQLLSETHAEIIVFMEGIEEKCANYIQARYSYAAENIKFNHRYVEIMSPLPDEDGRRKVDFKKFHTTVPNGMDVSNKILDGLRGMAARSAQPALHEEEGEDEPSNRRGGGGQGGMYLPPLSLVSNDEEIEIMPHPPASPFDPVRVDFQTTPTTPDGERSQRSNSSPNRLLMRGTSNTNLLPENIVG